MKPPLTPLTGQSPGPFSPDDQRSVFGRRRQTITAAAAGLVEAIKPLTSRAWMAWTVSRAVLVASW